jgi:hypothetical protein
MFSNTSNQNLLGRRDEACGADRQAGRQTKQCTLFEEYTALSYENVNLLAYVSSLLTEFW